LKRSIILALAITIILLSPLTPQVLSQSSDPAGPAKQRYRPVIGSIQIQMVASGYSLGYCTASYVAQDSSGNRYLAMASHCLYHPGQNQEVPATIYQPYYSATNYIGTVSQSRIYSNIDTAFVSLAVSSEPRVLYIWRYLDYYYGTLQKVKGYYDHNELEELKGETAWKTGRTTGTTSGTLEDYRYRCIILCLDQNCRRYKWVCGYIVASTNYIQAGDSGAPLFIYHDCYRYWTCNATLIGHVMGGTSSITYSMATWYVVSQTGISPVTG